MLPIDDVQLPYRTPERTEPDAHGQAALLLTESLIHSLVEKAILTNVEALVVIETAKDVKIEVATSDGESARRIQDSLDLLARMAASFKVDQL